MINPSLVTRDDYDRYLGGLLSEPTEACGINDYRVDESSNELRVLIRHRWALFFSPSERRALEFAMKEYINHYKTAYILVVIEGSYWPMSMR